MSDKLKGSRRGEAASYQKAERCPYHGESEICANCRRIILSGKVLIRK